MGTLGIEDDVKKVAMTFGDLLIGDKSSHMGKRIRHGFG